MRRWQCSTESARAPGTENNQSPTVIAAPIAKLLTCPENVLTVRFMSSLLARNFSDRAAQAAPRNEGTGARHFVRYGGFLNRLGILRSKQTDVLGFAFEGQVSFVVRPKL